MLATYFQPKAGCCIKRGSTEPLLKILKMNYQIHKGIVKIFWDIPERNCVGSIIFTNNETNDWEGDQFQPGHFKESVSVSANNSIGIFEKTGF